MTPSPRLRRARARGGVLRQDLSLREADEPFLIRSHLMDVDVVDPGLCVLVNLGEILAGVRSDDDALGDLLRRDELDRLLEVGRRGQLLTQFPREPGVRPDLMGGLQRSSFVLVPADRHLSITWTLATGTFKGLDDFLVRRGGYETIAETSR